MFGLTIVKKSSIKNMNDIISSCKESGENDAKYIKILEEDNRKKNKTIESLRSELEKSNIDQEKLSKNTFKISKELSEVRDNYKRSVEEKDDLKKLIINKDVTINTLRSKLYTLINGKIEEDNIPQSIPDVDMNLSPSKEVDEKVPDLKNKSKRRYKKRDKN